MTHGHPLRISRPVRREARHARGLGRTEAAGRRTPGAPMRPSPGALGVSAHRAAGLADWHNPNSSIVSDRVHSHSLDRPPAGGQSAPAPVSLLSRRARVPARPPTACLRQWLPRRRPPRGSRSGRLGGSHLRRLAGPKAAAKGAPEGAKAVLLIHPQRFCLGLTAAGSSGLTQNAMRTFHRRAREAFTRTSLLWWWSSSVRAGPPPAAPGRPSPAKFVDSL